MSINLGKALAKISPPSGYFRSNRTRLLSALTPKVGAYAKNACVFLKSGEDPDIHAEDSPEKLFCQENNLWWVSGCETPNCYAVIELASGNCTLFVKEYEESSKTWMTVLSDTDYVQNLEIDTCLYLDSMESWFKEKNFDQINVLEGTNPYSGRHPIRPEFSWMSGFLVNKQVLYQTINEVRVLKTSDDLDLLRQVGKLGCEGHIFVMQNMKPGMSESHVQSLFRLYGGYNMKSGVPYGEIAAAGENGAKLHYQTNIEDVNDGDMILFDGGFRVNMFCSDITTTWPVNGKFTEKQAKWYNMVLAASKAVFALAKPGVHWQDCHILAEKTILQGLIDLGVLHNGTMEEMWEKRVSWCFMPHGLGHYIGIYTHDYQGDQAKENIKKPIPNQSLRVNRVLEAGMCMTNEPGCYVIRGLLAEAKADAELEKYFNWEVLEEFAKEVQACRIEDDFVITEDGNENYTCYLPRTVAAIEACHAGLEWAHLN